jgi:predicted nucleotidyltransferase
MPRLKASVGRKREPEVNEIIREIATLASALDGVAAVVLVGSRATAQPGKADDWDLLGIMRAPEIPQEASRQRLWSSPESPVAEAEMHFGSCNDRFVLNGVDLGIDYNLSIPLVDKRLRQVLEEGRAERAASPWFCLGECPEVICADVESCVSLWDPDGIVAAWKEMVAPYPQRFRTNLLYSCLFEARFRLKDMRRGSDLRDIPLVHAGLSELALCLLRVLFALNRRWFPGVKSAMRTARRCMVIPDDWIDDLERVLSCSLGEGDLKQVHAEAESLTVRLSRLATAQGEEERQAVCLAAANWPDVDPMHF